MSVEVCREYEILFVMYIYIYIYILFWNGSYIFSYDYHVWLSIVMEEEVAISVLRNKSDLKLIVNKKWVIEHDCMKLKKVSST